MSLSPIGNPAWKTVRGVRFAMQYGASLVAILVTNAALDEMELVPESGYLERRRQQTVEDFKGIQEVRGSPPLGSSEFKDLQSRVVTPAKPRAWLHYFLAPARGSQIQAMCEPTGRP